MESTEKPIQEDEELNTEKTQKKGMYTNEEVKSIKAG